MRNEVKWSRQHAQESQIPKRPLLLEELVTSKSPFYRSVLYFANLLLCSAAILPKGERKKGSEKTGRRKAALLWEPEPMIEMQRAKPGLLVTSEKIWFIYSSPPAPTCIFHSGTAALPPSAIELIISALNIWARPAAHEQKVVFWNFKVMYKGFNFSPRYRFYFQICHCGHRFMSCTMKKQRHPLQCFEVGTSHQHLRANRSPGWAKTLRSKLCCIFFPLASVC